MTKEEARLFLEAEKHVKNNVPYDFPVPGEQLCVELFAKNPRVEFLLDISRGHIKLTKHTFQNRVFKAIVLARLDIDGNPHRNPDGKEVGKHTCTYTTRTLETSGLIHCHLVLLILLTYSSPSISLWTSATSSQNPLSTGRFFRNLNYNYSALKGGGT